MSRSTSRIPAWTVTSSAVVGSSAISTFGSQASAIAIITRWRMPPESWCGYSSQPRARAPGCRPARAARSRARPRRAPRRPWWRRSTSPIWRPTVKHRVERRHRLLEHVRDLAAADAAQLATRTAPSRSTARRSATEPVTLRVARQQPDQRHRGHALAAAGLADEAEHLALGRASNDARRRRAPAPSSVAKRDADRSAHVEQAAGRAQRVVPRVEGVAQAVAEQVERERADDDREPRVDRRATAPSRNSGWASGEHHAQRRRRRPDAEAEERQHRLADDRRRDRHRRLHDAACRPRWAGCAGAARQVAGAVGDRGGDEVQPAQRAASRPG